MGSNGTNVVNEDADTSGSLSASLDSAKSTINLQINRIYGNVKYMDFLVPQF